MVLHKCILTQADLQYFLQHPICDNFLAFIQEMNSSVKDLKLSDIDSLVPNGRPQIISSLLHLLETAVDSLSTFPKSEKEESAGAGRFGKLEFREYHDYIQKHCGEWINTLISDNCDLPEESLDFVVQELSSYFVASFGNRERIDYGTGHEVHFIVFLHCLDRLGLFDGGDGNQDLQSSTNPIYSQLVLLVFWKYLHWMRRLQIEFWLEPAGSHGILRRLSRLPTIIPISLGVWGLDDYHFFPFFFGSAQLYSHKYIKPKSIHDNEIVQEFSREYLYLSCIKFVNQIKSESLAWHSPMLNDISGVKTWHKVNSGLLKMFHGEVLSKLPIMQHLLLGSLFGNIGVSGTPLASILKKSEMEVFSSPSGHAVALISATESQGEREVPKEMIVKYVTGPNGEKRPIYGRLISTDCSNGVHSCQDTYAFGQAHPECCGIRVPSAIGAKLGGKAPKDLLPFD